MPRFNAETFRRLHRLRGERYRWWKAVRAEGEIGAESNGILYIEQTLPVAARALFNAETGFDSEEPGIFAVGDGTISVMPDESYLKRPDRISRPDAALLRVDTIVRDEGDTDALKWQPAVEIREVRAGLMVYLTTDYVLTADGKIQWVGTAPALGTDYTVEYLYEPLYVFEAEQRTPRPDKNGVLMPQRGSLRLMRAGETE